MKTILLAALLATACSKGSSVDGAAYKSTRDTVKGMTFADATAKAQATLGPPNEKTDDRWRWAGISGDQCYDLSLSKNSDGKVGVSGGSVHKMVEELFAKCKALADVAPAK